jgi:hypothetical protein
MKSTISYAAMARQRARREAAEGTIAKLIVPQVSRMTGAEVRTRLEETLREWGPLTADECIFAWQMDGHEGPLGNVIPEALTEMEKKHGTVEKTGAKRNTRLGRPASVYQLKKR